MKQLKDQNKSYFVSTTKLNSIVNMLDRMLGSEEDQPYETMVFSIDVNGDIDFGNPIETYRYSSEQAAINGHKKMVKKYIPYIEATVLTPKKRRLSN